MLDEPLDFMAITVLQPSISIFTLHIIPFLSFFIIIPKVYAVPPPHFKSSLCRPKNNHILKRLQLQKLRQREGGYRVVVCRFALLFYCAGRMHISCKPLYFVIISFYVIVLPFSECTAFEEVKQFGSHKSTNNKVYQVYQFYWTFLHNFFHLLCFFFLNVPNYLRSQQVYLTIFVSLLFSYVSN